MATRSDKGEDFRNIMKCSICMEPLKNPKSLPCIHTFCLACLEKYGEDEQPGEEVPCPVCLHMFRIPAGGFKQLPSNIFVERMQGAASTGVPCDVCQAGDAKNYCVECAESMCDACSVRHKNIRVTRAHKVVSLADKDGSQV